MGMASCHLRHQRMCRGHITVLLDSCGNGGSLTTSPDLGATTAAVSARLSTQPLPIPNLSFSSRTAQARWQSESWRVW